MYLALVINSILLIKLNLKSLDTLLLFDIEYAS